MIAANKLYVPILEQNLSKENNEKTQEVFIRMLFIFFKIFFLIKEKMYLRF